MGVGGSPGFLPNQIHSIADRSHRAVDVCKVVEVEDRTETDLIYDREWSDDGAREMDDREGSQAQ